MKLRYFKYKNTNKNYNDALKEQYKTLNRDDKRIFRKEKRWRRISCVATCVIFVALSVVGLLLLKSIPKPSEWGWSFLLGIGKVFAGIIIIVVSAALTVGLTMPLWKKAESFHLPSMKKEIFSKACGHLRDYYGLREPYIITKCFDASDIRFRNHDVCIFAVGDELRITTDLIHGFLHGERDLGCYAFKKHELTLTKQQEKKCMCVELKADNTTFLLGYRAKSFIEKI